MELRIETTNNNFNTAFTFVLANYTHLFHSSLRLIRLEKTKNHYSGANGIHYRINNESIITIRSGRRTVADFVCTLVHELTHLQQSVNTPLMHVSQREKEAHYAGHHARLHYTSSTS